MRSKYVKNALFKHQRLKHQGQPEAVFEAETIQNGIRYNLERFVAESLHIENAKNDPHIELMNQKGEWGHGGIRRVQFTND